MTEEQEAENRVKLSVISQSSPTASNLLQRHTVVSLQHAHAHTHTLSVRGADYRQLKEEVKLGSLCHMFNSPNCN